MQWVQIAFTLGALTGAVLFAYAAIDLSYQIADDDDTLGAIEQPVSDALVNLTAGVVNSVREAVSELQADANNCSASTCEFCQGSLQLLNETADRVDAYALKANNTARADAREIDDTLRDVLDVTQTLSLALAIVYPGYKLARVAAYWFIVNKAGTGGAAGALGDCARLMYDFGGGTLDCLLDAIAPLLALHIVAAAWYADATVGLLCDFPQIRNELKENYARGLLPGVWTSDWNVPCPTDTFDGSGTDYGLGFAYVLPEGSMLIGGYLLLALCGRLLFEYLPPPKQARTAAGAVVSYSALRLPGSKAR